MDIDVPTAQRQLTIAAAHQRLCRRELERAIYRAARHAGLTQRQISDIVGSYSQATIQRIIRRMALDPSLLEESPTDTVDRRAAGLITDEEMMNKLLHRNYGFGAAVRIDGVVTDAYARGTWDDIEMAYYQRLLTDDESHTLADYPLRT
ncbi:hypothetical protein [Mycobacteroides abscessus]|uniref:Uncharacterized protein n=3 Tax=Mycobacteroides abscessus TaxID=36809 RepID=B1MMB7_MYCA9|nr:hypothetical protein [Mycobacteroides abscessus]EIU40269.1 hypothetical protein MA6G0125R_4031 [Mycobacteroides abscessus 6G-0125-R]EIU52528.1 hypothetical protein MA6G1108_5000 [Mycobacteroides abscessus 6G-1108]EIU54532.1 hypothetical protein MA6G0728S_4761 [Mycobacteroides abscessus 6G-0728-S]EIU90093.1 hypothetical protein MA6G0212_5057 [Mycobacteroides abscessus 6G-0212]EIU96186.1 hypothetical protein MA6G0728R_5002 [Mycobacteroides abscessus 6G-0728-R]EIV20634.1 hypothetical protein 